MDENVASGYYNEGLNNIKTRDWEAALKLLNQAIAQDPKHVNSYNALGKVYHQMGEVEDAKRCWRTALRLDPDNVTARQCLDSASKEPAKIRVRTLLWVAVVVALLMAAMIITNFVLLRRIGDMEAQIATLEAGKATTAFASDTGSPDIVAEAGSESERSQQRSQPPQTSAVQKTSENEPAAQSGSTPTSPGSSQLMGLYAQGLADCRSGAYSRAIASFRKILEYPSFHELKDNAQYWIAECHYARKDYQKALTEFQKVKRNFPKGNKVFDAELKIAYTYYNLKKMKEAEQKLVELSKHSSYERYSSRIDGLLIRIRSRKAR